MNISFKYLQAGEAPIHVAARYGHAAVIDYLCSVDADVNLQDKVMFSTRLIYSLHLWYAPLLMLSLYVLNV